MPTGIQLSSGIVAGVPKSLDAKYGPYDSVNDALNDLSSGLRHQGLTVGIKVSGSVVEYWFKDGVANEDFVEKQSVADWNTLANKPSTFTPSAHASSHHTGGSDQLAAHQINGQTIFATGNVVYSSDQNLEASRALQFRVGNTNASGINLTLPTAADGTLNGDTIVIIGGNTMAGPITVRRINVISPLIYETLATISTTGEQYRFRAGGSTTGSWSLVPVDTHTHTLSDITDAGTAAASDTGDFAAASHTHGNLSNDGKIGSTSGLPLKTGTDGVVEAGAFGTSAGQFAEGNHIHDQLEKGTGLSRDTFTVKAGGINGFFFAKTFNTSDPAIGIESYNTSNIRQGFAFLGIRGVNGFLQGSTNTFRIEQGGGNLANLQCAKVLDAPVEFVIACSDETTALTAGVAKVTFRAPVAFRLTSVAASVTVATTVLPLVVDINNGANSVLSTKLSIDATEKTSATAATAAVINTSFRDFTQDAEITIDIDQIGTVAGAGLKVILRGTRL